MPTAPPADEPDQDAHAPREVFSALFETVLEELERNPDFAQRLADRLGDRMSIVVRPTDPPRRPRAAAPPPPELEALNVAEALEADGQIALRERLSRHTNRDLAALVRARGLSSDPVSRMNKGQLLNAIIRSA